MGYALKLWLIFSIFIFLIVWASKPELIDKAYKEITAPYREYISKQNAAIWKTARESEYSNWVATRPLPEKCSSPKTGLINIECYSLNQEREKEFNAYWLLQINKGWKPYGIN